MSYNHDSCLLWAYMLMAGPPRCFIVTLAVTAKRKTSPRALVYRPQEWQSLVHKILKQMIQLSAVFKSSWMLNTPPRQYHPTSCICCCCCWVTSVVSDSATLWTAAFQAPPSVGFSRQERRSGLPCPSPGDLPNPGIKPGSPATQADSLPLSHAENPQLIYSCI